VEKAVAEPNQEDVQRWTTRRKAARQHGITIAELEDWKERFLLAVENALPPAPLPPKA